MKKIVSFQNKGGMILTRKWDFNDKELLEILGTKGMKKFYKELLLDMQKAKKGNLECYPIEDVFKELDNIIHRAMIKQHDI